MKKQIILLSVLIASTLLGQTKLQNENIERNKLTLKFNSLINYSIIKSNNKNIFRTWDYQDESSPGDVKLPTNSIFISLPQVESPKIRFTILSKKEISAIPEFNDDVELSKEKEIIYSKAKIIKNSKNSHFKVKGYLWIENNYCLHLEVAPAIFISSRNTIELIDKFEIELTYQNDISILNNLIKKSIHSNIISNNNYIIQNINDKFNIHFNDSWIDYSKTYLKLGTSHDGIYRVKQTDIELQGINTYSINPKTFKLILKGEEIPIWVEGETDQSFDENDFIEFAGIRNMGDDYRKVSDFDKPYNEYLGRYTDTTIYWLTWDGVDGKRVDISVGEPETSQDTLDYYTQIDHYERNGWFDFSCASLVRRETPYWIENKTWHEGNIGVGMKDKSFSVDDVYPNKVFKMFIKFQDFASNISSNAHLVSLGLNSGEWGDSIYVDKYEQVVLEAELNSDLLNSGNNILNINSLQTKATVNALIFDWYEIEYPRYLKPINKSLNFIFPFIDVSSAKNVKLQNIFSDNFSIWQFGETYRKYNLNRINDEIVFADTISSTSKFIYMDETKILSPKIYYAKQFVNLRSSENKADYLAITHKKFMNIVVEYTSFISNSYEIDTKIIDIDDIYDEYSFGFFNPEAIQDFLKSTHEYWQFPKPSSVILIGGATYDYYGNKFKYVSSVTERVLNYVPSFGAPVSDNWFVAWDTTGAYIPQMKIGRLPVTTNEEFGWYFEKHKNYVTQEYDDWNKRYMFFSSGDASNPSEVNSMYESNQFVIDNYVSEKPIGGKSEHFYKTLEPPTNFGPYPPEYFQNAIDNGSVFISYLGHSGTQIWDNSITSPSQLKNNRNRYPIVSDFGCSTGRFAEPDITSFSELFTIGSEGQALGYIGNASLGFVSTSLLMPKLFYKKILMENIHSVSEAHKEAKLEMLQTYGATGIYELFALTNTFIGDPVLSLSIPILPNFVINDRDILTNSSILNDLMDSTGITIRFNNYGSVLDDTLSILIVHQFQTSKDSSIIKVGIPNFEDAVIVNLPIKNKAGNHTVTVSLDPNGEYEEISKDDNIALKELNVASSSIRPMINYQFINGLKNNLSFLNPSSRPSEEKIIFNVSFDSEFNNLNRYEISFDSITSIFSLDNLAQNNRYWFRTKIKGESNYTTVFSFYKPGLKFWLQDSLSFENTSIRNLYFENDYYSIDTTIVKFELFSAGFDDGQAAIISRNGVNYVPTPLVGHQVVLFDIESPYEFKEFYYFNTFSEDDVTKYLQLLDTLSSNYLIAIAISDEGSNKLTTEVRNKLKEFGSTLIDNIGWRASWAFIGFKGATPGTMPEAYSASGNGPVTIDTTISFLSEKGNMLTSEIGPTGEWGKLVVSQEMPSNSMITYTPIGIRDDGVLDTLTELSFQDSIADLSHINSDLYPKMKILADFTASADKQSPVLKSLGVDYNDVAELAMNYQVVSVERDSIIQGENNKLSFYIYNVGETKADSFSVKIELQKPDNSSVILDLYFTSIDSSSKKKFEHEFTISESHGFGNMAFSITVDEEEKIREFFKDNNFYQIPFYVKKDTTTNINSAEIDVKFDGFEILDGDFVTNTPQILFELNYIGNFPLEDTSAIRFTLDSKRVYNSQMNIDYDTVNRRITYKYEPQLDDGQHYLRVTEHHELIDDNFGIDKQFTVSNELKALDIYNFPNPASDETDFTFRLARVPEELDIKIYTVAGRLIKVFELQSYDLKADINKIHWDLTDQDGDKIANGVYLYKIILRDRDKVEHYTEKLAIVR